MSVSSRLIVLGLALCSASVMLAAQGAGTAAARRPPASNKAAPPVLFGSIKELMDGVVDPTADVLFDAVSYTVTSSGVEETRPRTKEDWTHIRRHALLLAEVTNLLKMPGRRVAPEHPVLELESEDPGPEDLKPDQIQALIDADPASFTRLAQGLADAAMTALRAADAMDVDKLFESGEEIDEACENCHLQYWYPKDKRPAIDALSRRKK